MARWQGMLLIAGAVVLAGLLLFGGRLIGFYVDYLWFQSLGYQTVFLTNFWARTLLSIGGALLFLALFLANAWIAVRLARRLVRHPPTHIVGLREGRGPSPFGAVFGGGPYGSGAERPRPFGDLAETMGGPRAAQWLVEHGIGAMVLAGGLGLALLMGLAASAQWSAMLRWLHQVPFGTADPVFGHDVGFYVYTLPLLGFWQAWLAWAVVLSGAAVALIYLLALYAVDDSLEQVGFLLATRARAMRTHLLLLAAALLALVAAGFWFGSYGVVLARHDRMLGADFTDLHARLPATRALAAAAALAALAAAATVTRRGYSLLAGAAVLFAVVLVIGRGALPLLVQRLQVEPAELRQEAPYLARNIQFTRQAYGLDRVSQQVFPAEDTVTADEIRDNQQTIANIRLWDPRPLKDTFNQLQSIRPYYSFDDVDVDRYTVGGQYRQVMLSARELALDRLGTQAQSWVNRRLQYTHGYGVVMSPVNEVSPEGRPSFFIQDLPPAGQLKVDRPEVYYGEQTGSYVIVDTGVKEFDYPSGEQNVFTTFQGGGGVAVGPIWRRLALAWYFGDFNFLVSTYLKPESRVLFRRVVKDRVQRLAPFLKLDADPYLVVADGKLVWLIDGYTTTDRFPYSQLYVERTPVLPGAGGAGTAGAPGGAGSGAPVLYTRTAYNYIRNSAKIAVDAYDGSVTIYLADPNDPLIRTYAAIYPGLFRPLEAMPASLRAHIRYPEDLFRVQAQLLRAYHVQDVQVFYNAEDLWNTATERQGDRPIPVEPYYVIMRLPGQPSEEFLLMLPFTPAGKDNMVAWLAARSDGAEYGKLLLYQYPRDRLIYGPSQVDGRIDNNPEISAQLTLWNQQGSRVIRGNLLVIPIGRSTLYVEPIYLQSESIKLPEFKRVVVASGNQLAMDASLPEVLARLFGPNLGLPSPAPPGAAPPATALATAPPPNVSAAAKAARDAYQRALEALKNGDFATFGEELKNLDARLRELEAQAEGTLVPSAPDSSPAASPTPAATPRP